MSAISKWSSLRQSLLDDAQHLDDQYPLIEASDIHAWVEETGDGDLTHALSEALCDIDEVSPRANERDKLNALLTWLCAQGDDLPTTSAGDLLERLRSALRCYCQQQVERFIDREAP